MYLSLISAFERDFCIFEDHYSSVYKMLFFKVQDLLEFRVTKGTSNLIYTVSHLDVPGLSSCISYSLGEQSISRTNRAPLNV